MVRECEIYTVARERQKKTGSFVYTHSLSPILPSLTMNKIYGSTFPPLTFLVSSSSSSHPYSAYWLSQMGSPMSVLKREGYCIVWVHWVQTKPGAESMRPPQKLRPAQRFGHRSQCHAAAGGCYGKPHNSTLYSLYYLHEGPPHNT